MTKSKKVDLIDLVIIFVRNRKLFLSILISITAIGIVVAFLWPKTYKADLSYVVNSSNSLNLSSGGLLSGLANLSVANTEITADQILIILRSTRLIDEVIEEFNLAEQYGTDIKEALRKKLNANIVIEDFREGGIGLNSIIATKVSLIDENPERAFQILNFYFKRLNEIVEELNKSNIEKGYRMLETRLEKNLTDLKNSEDSLRAFQEHNGILEIEEQTKALIQNISTVKAELVGLEIQIAVAKTLLSEASPEIQELQLKKEAVQNRYNDFLRNEGDLGASFDIYKPLDQIPRLFIEYVRKVRELEVQQEIYKVLYPQYEQQKLNYEEISSGLTIIDPPITPTYKYSPKRAYIMIAFFLFGMILSTLVVFLSKWKEDAKQNNTESYRKFQELKKSF